MSGCGDCSGGCSSCGNCGGGLVLYEQERVILETLAQIPFLPIARKDDSMDPVFFDDRGCPVPEFSPVLQSLEHKRLVRLDYDAPLTGFHSDAYDSYPLRGSMALTARGQAVLDLLDIQGAEDL